MSQSFTTTVKCPACGQPSEWRGYSSVNVTLEPALKEKVLRGELFAFNCPKCGTQAQINAPMLYHDMTQHLMIQLQPSDAAWNPEALDAPMQRQTGDVARIVQSTVTRRVRTLNELREKILLFDAGLDDRVVECLKLRLKAMGKVPEYSELYFERASDSGLVFTEMDEDGSEQLTMNTEAFKSHAAAFQNLEPISAERWPTVDAAYAAALYERLAGGE